MTTGPWLIAGLGNPGPEYATTRHNIGFHVVEALAARTGAKLARHKRAHALVAEARLGMPGAQQRIVLAEPLSFMNESGGPVSGLLDFYDIDAERLIAIHDELDLPYASLRVKLGGGDNGHNGLRSIRRSLGTGDFLRVRAGIGRPPGRQDPAAFVLKPFTATEREELPDFIDRLVDAVECLVEDGLERTQNRFND